MKFVDINAQFRELESDIRQAIDGVLSHGQYIMGPEVAQLEKELSDFCGAKHTISTASGTDALLMALMAHGVGPGDAIIVPPFTFVATAEVVQLLNATSVFVDVEADTFNMNPALLEETILRVQSEGKLNLKGIIPVDLFGLPANYSDIEPIAAKYNLFVLSDGAQSFGGSCQGQKVGTFGDISATSFFPAKPLGCYGDGGAVFTNDDEMAAICQSIRFHGMGDNPYDNVRTGITGRLDTLQAAILSCKLKVFPDEIIARQRIADRYSAELSSSIVTPSVPAGYQSAWAQYTILSDTRDELRAHLTEKGIPTAIYYPKGLHQQPAFSQAEGAGVEMPVSEMLSEKVLSLPIHPYLTEDQQAVVIQTVNEKA